MFCIQNRQMVNLTTNKSCRQIGLKRQSPFSQARHWKTHAHVMNTVMFHIKNGVAFIKLEGQRSLVQKYTNIDYKIPKCSKQIQGKNIKALNCVLS